MSKIAFVHLFSTHYTRRLFELLSMYHDVQFIFVSKGNKWFWPSNHGTREGNFKFCYAFPYRKFWFEVNLNLLRRLSEENFDIIISGITGRFELPATFIYSKVSGKPIIIWTGIWSRLGSKFQSFFFPILKYIYQHSDAIVVYGAHVKQYLISEGISEEKIFIAPHSTDNSLYKLPVSELEIHNLKNKYNLSESKNIILFLGRLEESKGPAYLIESLINVNLDFQCVIAGAGPEEGKLFNMVRELGLDRKVIFTGYIPIDEARFFYAISKVFVLPSITTIFGKEPWGFTINEAFNQSLPVIVTEAVGAAAGGLVIDGYNGIIVREKDAEAIADAINTIFESDHYDDFKQNAKDSVEKMTQEAMVDGFLSAIRYIENNRKKM